MARVPVILGSSVRPWAAGMAQDQHTGFGMINNADIYGIPGSYRGLPSMTASSDVDSAHSYVKWIVPHSTENGTFFALTFGHKVYRYTTATPTWTDITAGGLSAGFGNGIIHYRGRLYVVSVDGSGNGKVDYYAGGSWTTAAHSFTIPQAYSPGYCPTIVADDGNLYFGYGDKVARIDTAFAYTAAALSLPTDSAAYSLANLNGKLYVGGSRHYNAHINDGFIIGWTIGQGTFDQIMRVPYAGVISMTTYNNQIYFLMGSRPTLYVTNGSSFAVATSIPAYMLSNPHSPQISYTPQSLAVFGNEMGWCHDDSTANGQTFAYSLETGALRRYSFISNHPKCLCPYGGGFWQGTNDQTVTEPYRMYIERYDPTSTSLVSPYMTSPILEYGSIHDPYPFPYAYLSLDTPLTTGQTVTVYVKTALDVGFSNVLCTFTYSATGAKQFMKSPCGYGGSDFKSRGWFQLQIISPASVRVRSLILP